MLTLVDGSRDFFLSETDGALNVGPDAFSPG